LAAETALQGKRSTSSGLGMSACDNIPTEMIGHHFKGALPGKLAIKKSVLQSSLENGL
jgi:hypothetical protein